jgi:DNA-binding HxlR family transcriptional regulator
VDSRDVELVEWMHDLKQVARGDWPGLIMILLEGGPRQYRELRDEVAEVVFEDGWSGRSRRLSNTELARTLARMVADGLLVRREVSAQWTPAVWYELSDSARELWAAAEPLLAWVGANRAFFAQAQAARRGTSPVPHDRSG